MGVGMEHEEALFAQVAESPRDTTSSPRITWSWPLLWIEILAQVNGCGRCIHCPSRLVVKGTDRDHTKINYIGTLDIPYVKMAKSSDCRT